MQKSVEKLRLEGIYRNGFGIVPKFVMHDPDLSLESKAIYAYLCALAGGGEQTFPFRETILRQLRISKNTYYRHYNPLIEQGYITVERPSSREGANIYTLVSNPKKLQSTAAEGEAGMLRYTGLKSKGYGSIPRAVMTDSRLSIKAKGLYAYFCSYCGAGDCAFPYRKHILFHLKISEPTYYKAMVQLRKLDYLRTVQRKTGGRFAVNDYYLNEFPEAAADGAAGGGQAVSAPEAPCAEHRKAVPDEAREVPCAEHRKAVPDKAREAPCAENRDAVPDEAREAPCAENRDAVPDEARKSPCPEKCDTEVFPCPTNGDMEKWDTRSGDNIILNNRSSSNRSSIDRSGAENALRDLAWDYLCLRAPEEADRLLEEFLPRFLRGAKGREVRNPAAYLNASLHTFLAERTLRESPSFPAEWGGEERSYDLMELEELINRPIHR